MRSAREGRNRGASREKGPFATRSEAPRNNRAWAHSRHGGLDEARTTSSTSCGTTGVSFFSAFFSTSGPSFISTSAPIVADRRVSCASVCRSRRRLASALVIKRVQKLFEMREITNYCFIGKLVTMPRVVLRRMWTSRSLSEKVAHIASRDTPATCAMAMVRHRRPARLPPSTPRQRRRRSSPRRLRRPVCTKREARRPRSAGITGIAPGATAVVTARSCS